MTSAAKETAAAKAIDEHYDIDVLTNSDAFIAALKLLIDNREPDEKTPENVRNMVAVIKAKWDLRPKPPILRNLYSRLDEFSAQRAQIEEKHAATDEPDEKKNLEERLKKLDDAIRDIIQQIVICEKKWEEYD